MYKICLVGGEDSHKRIELSQYLIKAGFSITILGTGNQEFPENINYVKYSLNRNPAPFSDYKTLKWFQKFFRTNTFDLIHTFDTKPAFLVPIALKKFDIPVSRTITGVGKTFTSSGIYFWTIKHLYFALHKLCKQRVSNTVFQNTDDQKLFLDHKLIDKKNSSLIFGSGIDLSQYPKKAKRDSQPFTFICVSRLIYVKGITFLIEATKICRERGYDFKVKLVGPVEENSTKFSKKMLEDNSNLVEWLGTRNDVNELLQSVHAFVLPTFGEGLPRVLMEAAASGLPIISTYVTGVKDFLTNEHDALIIPDKNSEALANAMIRLFESKPLTDKLVENASITVEKYSLDKIAKQYIAIFKAEIEKRK